MLANTPEKQHYDRIYELEFEIGERREDLKAVRQAAKEAGCDVKKINLAVKRALADQDKLKERRDLEDDADALRKALGDFHDSPLGNAAVRAVS